MPGTGWLRGSQNFSKEESSKHRILKNEDFPINTIHGTPRAYWRHMIAGEDACDDCLEAWEDEQELDKNRKYSHWAEYFSLGYKHKYETPKYLRRRHKRKV